MNEHDGLPSWRCLAPSAPASPPGFSRASMTTPKSTAPGGVKSGNASPHTGPVRLKRIPPSR